MSAVEFSEDEQYVMVYALRDRYRQLYKVRTICADFAENPPTYPGAPTRDEYSRDVVGYDANLAGIEAIAAKLPAPRCWDRLAAEARADVDAERSARAA